MRIQLPDYDEQASEEYITRSEIGIWLNSPDKNDLIISFLHLYHHFDEYTQSFENVRRSQYIQRYSTTFYFLGPSNCIEFEVFRTGYGNGKLSIERIYIPITGIELVESLFPINVHDLILGTSKSKYLKKDILSILQDTKFQVLYLSNYLRMKLGIGTGWISDSQFQKENLSVSINTYEEKISVVDCFEKSLGHSRYRIYTNKYEVNLLDGEVITISEETERNDYK